MQLPQITINGVTYEMKTPARVWRLVMEFNDKRKEHSTAEMIDKYCEVIAQVYGVEVDEVLNNLPLDEVYPQYIEIYNAVSKILTSKLGKKTEENPDET